MIKPDEDGLGTTKFCDECGCSEQSEFIISHNGEDYCEEHFIKEHRKKILELAKGPEDAEIAAFRFGESVKDKGIWRNPYDLKWVNVIWDIGAVEFDVNIDWTGI